MGFLASGEVYDLNMDDVITARHADDEVPSTVAISGGNRSAQEIEYFDASAGKGARTGYVRLTNWGDGANDDVTGDTGAVAWDA